jgi:hypothetical protein
VLRERGIKVITTGFSNPTPSDEILQQRLAAWRAHWEQEREIISASRELEAARIRNRARALAQREMTFALGKIFEHGEVTDEVLAIRVLQALESAAADPKTREFLPSDTINLMNQIHRWLLEEHNGKPEGNGRSPETPTLPAGEPPAPGERGQNA